MARGMTTRHVDGDAEAAAMRAALRAMQAADHLDRARLLRRAAKREQRMAWARVAMGVRDALHEAFITGLDAWLPEDMQPFEDYMIANDRPFRCLERT